MPQHFVAPPQWEWYIVWYFFLGGLAGGAYLLGTILRLLGDRRDADMARLAFLVALPALAICPILLTLHLGRPLRFLHMLVNSRAPSLNFKYWSPMSAGVWVLLIFGAFAFVSFLEAVVGEERFRLLRGSFGRLFIVVGAFFGVFLAGYTGVLLSVSNQPIWSDTWALGGLFLASGLSVAAAALGLLAPPPAPDHRGQAPPRGPILHRARAPVAARLLRRPRGDRGVLPASTLAHPLGARARGHAGTTGPASFRLQWKSGGARLLPRAGRRPGPP